MTKQTLIVSERGQITLPKQLRDRLAIEPGSTLIAEEQDGQLILRPAVVTPVRIYSDKEIEDWITQDALSPSSRKRILRKAKHR